MRELIEEFKAVALLVCLPFVAIWLSIRGAPDILRASIIRNLYRFGWITLSAAEDMARMHGLRSSSTEALLYRKDQRLYRAYREGNDEAQHARWVANLDEDSRSLLRKAGQID